MIEIKHKRTGEVLLSLDADDLRGFDFSGIDLRGANLRGVDLRGTNFRNADLRGTDLSEADLHRADLRRAELSEANLRGAKLDRVKFEQCIGNGREITTIQTRLWDVVFTADQLAIGCERHSIHDWASFSDARIAQMSLSALSFWRRYKGLIFGFIEASRDNHV